MVDCSVVRFSDVPKFTHGGSYAVDVGLSLLEGWLERQSSDFLVDLDPDFQRGHVWTEEQHIRYVEFLLRGGQSQLTLYWNHPAYMSDKSAGSDLDEQMVLVDGKQRLTACLKFMRNEIPVFGHYLREYSDPNDLRGALGMSGARLRMNVNNLQTRREMLQWYLDLNDGGVVHTKDEIARVRGLLDEEVSCD